MPEIDPVVRLPLGHRIALWVLVPMFLGFAALQFNDPDPATWISIYGIAALVCLIASLRPLPFWLPGLLCIGAIIGAIVLWPSDYQGLTGKMDSRPGVELARESLGLIICALAMGYVALLMRRGRPSGTAS